MRLILQHHINNEIRRFHLHIFDSVIFFYNGINDTQTESMIAAVWLGGMKQRIRFKNVRGAFVFYFNFKIIFYLSGLSH